MLVKVVFSNSRIFLEHRMTPSTFGQFHLRVLYFCSWVRRKQAGLLNPVTAISVNKLLPEFVGCIQSTETVNGLSEYAGWVAVVVAARLMLNETGISATT